MRQWSEGDATVLLLEPEAGGRVTLRAGDATLSAESVAVWLTKIPGTSRRAAQVALVGDALLVDGGVERGGETLGVDLVVEGRLNLQVAERRPEDASALPAYQQALAARPAAVEPTVPDDDNPPDNPSQDDPRPDDPPDTRPAPEGVPVSLQVGRLRTLQGEDGRLIVEVSDGVFVLQRGDDGSLTELRADRGVIFTAVEQLEHLADGDAAVDWRSRVTGVYLEGDVRVNYLPEAPVRRAARASDEQRLTAEQAFYDFVTGRATLTRAVLHTSAELPNAVPLTVRADTIRRVAENEYVATSAEVTTSRFASPSYSLNAGRIFVRTRPGSGGRPTRTVFGGDNFTLRTFGVPVFYFPFVRGVTIDQRLPLRKLAYGDGRDYGQSIETTWGVFETVGATPPESLDATYSLDYFTLRGPRLGLDVKYSSDLFLPFEEERPSNFRGKAKFELLTDDDGVDRLARRRRVRPEDQTRYRLSYEHLQFFPGGAATGGTDYALGLRLGRTSDPTYLGQWDKSRFNNGPPHDFQLWVEQRSGNERLVAEFATATTSFTTSADLFQENLYVARYPELRYGRIGDRLGPISVTSRVRLGLLSFDRLSPNIARDFGFPIGSPPDEPIGIAGFPAFGYTGRTADTEARLDLRQQAALPIDLGPLRAMPFVVGRVTGYTDSPDGDALARAFAGGGVRLGTVFTRVDDQIYSRILDIDRMRHVVEPYALAFAGAATTGLEEAYIYDEGVDPYDTVQLVQVGLRQRWQTYRGPPGRKRSVDVFDVNVSAAWFGEGRDPDLVRPPFSPITADDFRGYALASQPELSVPRDTAEGSALWRVSDSTALVSDAAVTLGEGDLVTAAGGLVARRGSRLGYRIGGRYVRPLDQLVLSAGGNYRISDRYSTSLSTRFDLDLGEFRSTRLRLTRQFEQATLSFTFYLDRIDDDQGIQFQLTPRGLPIPGFGSDTLDDLRQ